MSTHSEEVQFDEGRVCSYARSRMFATLWAYHCPPRAVGIPRAFSASAICRNVLALGVQLRPAGLDEESVRSELTAMLVGLRLALQLATETSPGTIKEVSFREVVDVEKTVESLKSAGVIKT